MTNQEISNQEIEAADTIREINEKYGIGTEDAAQLHKAYQKIHTAHVLTETQKTLKEATGLKQPCASYKSQLEWIVNHLETLFRPAQNVDLAAGI